uniref:DET1 partner of COP1 E3 ubiquitin ligase n=1 Tax=Microcebus murinus TaxID=30608 RepID=A0A8C5VF14_MICMU
MDHYVSTIKPRRIQNQNVIHRLERRRISSGKADQTSLEIYEYQGCQAAEDLLQGYEGEILSNGNDQRSVNVRGRLFERFFVLLHITNVAANGNS